MSRAHDRIHETQTKNTDCHVCGKATTRNRRVRLPDKVVLCYPCHGTMFTDYRLQRKLPKVFGP